MTGKVLLFHRFCGRRWRGLPDRLTTVALALVAFWLAPARIALAQTCPTESECTFEKPNLLIVMDYSSSMVQSTFGATTRWEAQVEAVRSLLANADLTDNMHIALSRFGHDPETTSGTTLAGDTSNPPITDGFAVDVPFDDPSGNYLECNASAILSAVDALPPPPTGGGNTIGTWTRGALQSALELIEQTRLSHPEDQARVYEIVLMTDGDWNCPDSFNQEDCDGGQNETDENPAPMAATLYADGVRVHVLAFGDATAATDLDALAQNGGTGAAIDAATPAQLTSSLAQVLQQVRDAVVVPECIGGLPRVMIIMDASSSMIAGNAPGETNWDKARYALAGNPDAPNPGDAGYVEPIFDRTVQVGRHTVAIEDVVHIGLIGYNLPTTQELMLQYAPCSRDNIEWAMDPYTSCWAPGCYDPYTDPDTSLTWTFQNSDTDLNPPFAQTTRSFMPNCNPGAGVRCIGLMFNTYTGEGVNFARVNVARYTSDPGSFALDPDTPFINILVTDGMTSPDSQDPVPILADMLNNGVPTYVIGFGAAADLDEAALNAYAVAGGTAMAFVVDPAQGGSADALAERITSIIGGLDLDPCCQLNDCSANPEPALPFCGNGTADDGEVCDDGTLNGVVGGSCNEWCTSTSYCGDGVVSGAELCDDTNTNETDGCRSDCSGSCGDGVRSGPEECDDGNTDETDACFVDCTRTAVYTPGGGGGTTGAGGSSGFGGGAAATGAGGSFGSGATGAGADGSGVGGSAGSGANSGTAAASGSGAGAGTSGMFVDGGVDNGAGADGSGASGSDSGDEGGCGCRLGGARRASSALWLGVLGIAMIRRRRTRDWE